MARLCKKLRLNWTLMGGLATLRSAIDDEMRKFEDYHDDFTGEVLFEHQAVMERSKEALEGHQG